MEGGGAAAVPEPEPEPQSEPEPAEPAGPAAAEDPRRAALAQAHGLAQRLDDMGEYRAALPLARGALAARGRLLGPEGGEALQSLRLVGRVLLRMGCTDTHINTTSIAKQLHVVVDVVADNVVVSIIGERERIPPPAERHGCVGNVENLVMLNARSVGEADRQPRMSAVLGSGARDHAIGDC